MNGIQLKFGISFMLAWVYVFSFAQELHNPKTELGVKAFSFTRNLIGTHMTGRPHTDPYVQGFMNGICLKRAVKRIQFRAGFGHFQYHNTYQLSNVMIIYDADEVLDGRFSQHIFFVGLEKEFYTSRLRPFVFADIGASRSHYRGNVSWYYNGAQTGAFPFNAKGFGLGMAQGGGLKFFLSKNIVITYEMAFRVDKTLTTFHDDHAMIPALWLKYDPVHWAGMGVKF